MDDPVELMLGIATANLLAQEGSFRSAMRRTQSGYRTLQRQIDTLEKRLGFLVFHRTGDGLVPTPEGRQILQAAQRIEQITAQILRMGDSLNQETTGEVALAATEGLGTFWIAPQIHQFARIHPKITLRLNPSMALADMRQYGFDVALQVVEPVVPDIKRVRLGRLHMVLAAAPGYIEKHGRPKTVAELADHTFVFHTSPQSTDRRFIEDALNAKLESSRFMVMRNSAAHYVTIEQGMGLGFIPSYGFGIGVKLVPIPLPVRHTLDIWLCFHEASRGIPRVAAVIDWLSGIFDPRMFPWFRREFVAPRDFDAIIDANGSRPVIESISLNR
jgi:DNA-binding transcriptional LysR family regulator